MNTFVNAVKNYTETENGMPSAKSTLDECTDLFFKIGASRGRSILPDFISAFAQSPKTACKIALWARDIREGAGERQAFRDILLYLDSINSAYCPLVMNKVSELGRWDDLLLNFERNNNYALNLIATALKEGNGLCAKWMPRKGKKASQLRKFMGLTNKEYRKLLVGLTKVVETQMCSKEWASIDYNKVPSVAAKKYQGAFYRNDGERYLEYLKELSSGSGKAKVNAGAIYPYQLLCGVLEGSELAIAQWEALPDFLNGEYSILPVVDVSGSMYEEVYCSSNTCMEVAVSLGLYIAERNKGSFNNVVATFSEDSRLYKLEGSITERASEIRDMNWGMNTNINKLFLNILNLAVKNQAKQDDMPKYIVILSDMQFDSCNSDYVMDVIENAYSNAGYKVPVIVFWNLNARDNVPVTCDKHGTVLVSGFSPSIMKSVLAADFSKLTPTSIMIDTISNPRYYLE